MTANSVENASFYHRFSRWCSMYTSNRLFSYPKRVHRRSCYGLQTALANVQTTFVSWAQERREGAWVCRAAEHRIDEFVGRVSATLQHHLPARCLPWVLIQISRSHTLIQNSIQRPEWNLSATTRVRDNKNTLLRSHMLHLLTSVKSFILSILVWNREIWKIWDENRTIIEESFVHLKCLHRKCYI